MTITRSQTKQAKYLAGEVIKLALLEEHTLKESYYQLSYGKCSLSIHMTNGLSLCVDRFQFWHWPAHELFRLEVWLYVVSPNGNIHEYYEETSKTCISLIPLKSFDLVKAKNVWEALEECGELFTQHVITTLSRDYE